LWRLTKCSYHNTPYRHEKLSKILTFLKAMVLCNMPCSLVENSRFLQTASNHIPAYTTSHPRTLLPLRPLNLIQWIWLIITVSPSKMYKQHVDVSLLSHFSYCYHLSLFTYLHFLLSPSGNNHYICYICFSWTHMNYFFSLTIWFCNSYFKRK